MQRALQLAAKGSGFTAPNPMVGAVLVHDDKIIGEGWHHKYGGNHAEVDCLNNVSDSDKKLIPQSTLYVTLEPCAHYGQTPPCATRLVADKVKKVVIANTDPFEKVQGRGIEILKAGGVVVETGLLENECAWLNRRFFCFHQSNRPYIILKWAQTTDGFIAPADGSRFQITGPASRELVHKWRTEESAIMVGTNTARNDNPELTARFWQGNQPLRIVLDRNLTLPETSNLFNAKAPTWVINEIVDKYENGVRFVKVAFGNNLIDKILSELYKAKKLSLIVEGGTQLLNSFITAGWWDEARVFTGPQSLGSGIKSPGFLQNSNLISEMSIGNDQLSTFVNSNSQYRYQKGMPI